MGSTVRVGVYLATHNNPMFLRLALLQLEAQSYLPSVLAIHENGHPEQNGDIINRDILNRLMNKGVSVIYDHTPAGLSHPYFHYLPLKRLVDCGGCDLFMKWDHDDIFYESHIKRLMHGMRTSYPYQWIGQTQADILVLNSKQYMFRKNKQFVWNPLGGMSDCFMFDKAVAEQYLSDMLDRAGKNEADDWILHRYTLPKFTNGRMIGTTATACYVSHGRNDSTSHWVVKPPDDLR